MRGEIVFEKHPASADTGTRDAATFGSDAQLFGMNPQEGCGFGQVKRLHGGAPAKGDGNGKIASMTFMACAR